MFLNEGVFAIPTIIVALALLWQQLGPHALTGFACMLITVPLTGFATNRMSIARKTMMQHTDERVKLTSEVLIAIKVIKFYVWEKSFVRNIDSTRVQEMRRLLHFLLWRNLVITMVAIGPVVMSLVSFVTFSAVPGNILLPNVVFTSLSLFNLLRLPLTIVPMLIGTLVQLIVSVERFSAFFLSEEREEYVVPPVSEEDAADERGVPILSVKDAEYQWGVDGPSAVSGINFKAYPGDIIMIVGPVGSSKSAFISGLMGELRHVKGERVVRGRMAYVPQQAWIMNATVRENILFGQPYDEKKYKRVVEASALLSDFAMLPAGDSTEIGERGINLSGGQRQRISIARAAYSDSDIIAMDDPLSAVDAHVAHHLFFECFRGLLKDKTIVLVTNQLQFLSYATSIITLSKGVVCEQGTYDELMQKKGAFSQLIEEFSAGGAAEEEQKGSKVIKSAVEQIKEQTGGQLVLEETKEEGLVPYRRYLQYFRAGNIIVFSILILSFCLENATLAVSFWWLAQWSNYLISDPVGATQNQSFLLGIYAALGCGAIVFTVCIARVIPEYSSPLFAFFSVAICVIADCDAQAMRNMLFATFSVRASRGLHLSLISSVLRLPQSFFDTTPLGRILNRFTKDMDTVDILLPQSMQFMLVTAFMVLSTVVVVAVIQPVMTAAVVPLAVMFYLLARFFRYSSVELQRMESISRSPVFAQLSETLSGVTTIRAFGQTERMAKLFTERNDGNTRAFLTLQIANQWLGVRLDALGYLLLYLCATVLVVYRGTTAPGLAGFVLVQILQIMNYLNRFALQMADTETKMNSIERIEEFVGLPQEPPLKTSVRPPASWPDKGEVVFDNVSMRYRDGLPLVVKELTLTIRGGEKIGVVGRTGSGKSSVMLMLFRVVEPASGTIKIDGVDTGVLGLASLRKRLAIIPQEPFLFSGTVRMNLDPFNKCTDDVLWKTLEQVRLKEVVMEKGEGLDSPVAENGENFSVGQRQLICLGRALLRGAKILLMDEATASVDVETDQHIQDTVWSEFKDCTIITIAHRLNTIINYDRIMVMEGGKLVEFDTPQNLLARDGPFSRLVASTGSANKEYLLRMSGLPRGFSRLALQLKESSPSKQDIAPTSPVATEMLDLASKAPVVGDVVVPDSVVVEETEDDVSTAAVEAAKRSESPENPATTPQEETN